MVTTPEGQVERSLNDWGGGLIVTHDHRRSRDWPNGGLAGLLATEAENVRLAAEKARHVSRLRNRAKHRSRSSNGRRNS